MLLVIYKPITSYPSTLLDFTIINPNINLHNYIYKLRVLESENISGEYITVPIVKVGVINIFRITSYFSKFMNKHKDHLFIIYYIIDSYIIDCTFEQLRLNHFSSIKEKIKKTLK